MAKVNIIDYKWSGSWGPFKIKTSCGECDFNIALLKDMMDKEFKKKDVDLQIKPWLNNWFRVVLKGGWHAPVIMINGKLFAQGRIIKRKEVDKLVNSLL